jgi:hypothetical protein
MWKKWNGAFSYYSLKEKETAGPIQRGARGLQSASPATASCSNFICGFLYSSSFLDDVNHVRAAFFPVQRKDARTCSLGCQFLSNTEPRTTGPDTRPQTWSTTIVSSLPAFYIQYTYKYTHAEQPAGAGRARPLCKPQGGTSASTGVLCSLRSLSHPPL